MRLPLGTGIAGHVATTGTIDSKMMVMIIVRTGTKMIVMIIVRTGIAGHVATTGVFFYLVKMMMMMIIVRILFDNLEGHVITSPAIPNR